MIAESKCWHCGAEADQVHRAWCSQPAQDAWAMHELGQTLYEGIENPWLTHEPWPPSAN